LLHVQPYSLSIHLSGFQPEHRLFLPGHRF
jgi:hypothetical protein